MTTSEVPVLRLQAGDRFEHNGTHYYTVWSAPHRLGSTEVVVPVQFADGGMGERVFHVDATLTVTREDTA